MYVWNWLNQFDFLEKYGIMRKQQGGKIYMDETMKKIYQTNCNMGLEENLNPSVINK